MSDINLSASMRTNLLSLQNTQDLMDMTSERLSTGQKVNSAIDNPSSYYTASSLDNRASDLSALMDSMGQGLSVLSATDQAIESITNFVEQADAILGTARELSAASVYFNGEYTAPATDTTVKMDVFVDGSETPVPISFPLAANDDLAAFDAALQTALNALPPSGLGIADYPTVGEDFAPFSVKDGVITLSMYAPDHDYEFTNFVAEAGSPAAAVDLGFDMDKTLNNASVNAERIDAYERFDNIMSQITAMAGDASYNGINLLDGSGSALTVFFNEDRTSSLTVDGVDVTSFGLGLDEITIENFEDTDAIDKAMSLVDGAIVQLRSYASDFGNYYSTLENREEFTENLVNILTAGSDKLILADMNEESANMLALQTSQSLATNSLSLSSQAAQSVLQLF